MILPELWLDNQPLIGGGLLVWYYDQEEDLIKNIIL